MAATTGARDLEAATKDVPKDVSGDDTAKDNWNVEFESGDKPWAQLTCMERMMVVFWIFFKVCVIVGSLYLFICSLSFLASGFRLVAGREAGKVFQNNEVLGNPIAGMLMGVLVTVLVQSSSTSTSIIITMVAAELLSVKQAIALIMGANIGTSVTSTIVALTQANERDEFRRAFAAATVHDMFNFLSVLVLLPLEAATQYLYRFSKAIIDSQPGLTSGEKPPEILNKLTKPFTSEVIKVDKKVITAIAVAQEPEDIAALDGVRILKHIFGVSKDDISDGAAGAIILVFALAILCVTLFVIVFTLKKLLKGRIAQWLHRSVNGHVPDIKCGGLTIPMAWLSGYLAMGTGLVVTILVQSSSITTSALTPLVGVGVITVDRMYPTVLGANIGTCVTGVLAALAADSAKLHLTLQVAYAHLLFNISGIVLWYVVWPLRPVPINAAKFLGDTTAKYRWFALAYLLFAFFLIPAVFMAISLGSTAATIVVAILCVLVAAATCLINYLQKKRPEWLPAKLRNWDFLPKWLTSLEPIDRVFCAPLSAVFARTCACCPCLKSKKPSSPTFKATASSASTTTSASTA